MCSRQTNTGRGNNKWTLLFNYFRARVFFGFFIITFIIAFIIAFILILILILILIITVIHILVFLLISIHIKIGVRLLHIQVVNDKVLIAVLVLIAVRWRELHITASMNNHVNTLLDRPRLLDSLHVLILERNDLRS